MSQNDFIINNPSANQILVYSEIQKAFINVESGQTGTSGSVDDGVNIGGGASIFNDTQSGFMRFKTLKPANGITIENNGSHIEIGFNGDATTLGGLSKNDYLHSSKNLLDVDVVEARKNLKVYSTQEIDDGFLEANATNIPDNDNTYDLGSNGRRFADIYAVSFRGTATNAILAQDIEQKGAEDGQVLTWDKTEKEWLPKDALTGRIGDLIDVNLSNLENESVIVFNSSRNIWEALPLSSLGGGTGSGDSTAGTITDAENVGGGIGTFFTRFGGNLQFRSITGGSNVTITTNFNNEEVVINADVPQSTDDLSEGTGNRYFTDQRVRNVLGDVSIQDLGDMPVNGPTANQGPVWNGTRWEFLNLAVDIASTDDLSEGLSNFYFTQDRAFDAIDEYLLDASHGVTLHDLKDTNVSLSAGTYLYNDGSRWINRSIRVSDISDISLTGLSDGSSFVYNAANSRFEIGVLPQRLIDLQETTDSLHFSQESFDTFFGDKDADDLTESANRKFLNTTNLNNTLSTVSIGALSDVNLTNIADNSVLIWNSAQSAFVTADSSALNVTVDMGIEDLNNVSESSVLNAQDGYGLLYNAATGVFEAKDPSQNLLDLNDVSATTIQSGEVLAYQSGMFLPTSLIPYDASVSATDGSILQFDGASGKYVATTATGFGVSELGDLNDVTLTTITNEQVLVFDSTIGDFVNRNVSDVVNIESIGGVSISNLQTNDALIFDGINFTNVSYPNFDLQSLADGDIVAYSQATGKFENINPYEALNINYQAPSEGNVFVYNNVSGSFDVKSLNILDLGDVRASLDSNVDSAAYGLVWDAAQSQYHLQDLSAVVTIGSISNVGVTEEVDGATLRYNSSIGLYEIRQAFIGDNVDVDLVEPVDGNSLVWDSSHNQGNGGFLNGTPAVTVQELSNVTANIPQDGEGIVWSEAEGIYNSVKLDISYESVVKNSGALEFWNFDTTLTGTIRNIDLVADTEYTEYSVAAVGIKGSPSAQTGTAYDAVAETEADMLRADVSALTLEESKELSYDFWVQPSSAVTYNTAQKDSTVIAAMGVRANTLGESIVIRVTIEPTTDSFEHRIGVVKDGVVLGSSVINLNSESFNHIAVNYTKGSTNTSVEYTINDTQVLNLTVQDFIGDDSDNTLFIEALAELESGSRPYRLDNLSVYDTRQSATTIETKYKNIVSTGFTYSVPSIFGLEAVNVNNITSGDVLEYNGSEFVNVPRVSGMDDLSDVSLSGITSGDVLVWSGTQLIPATIDIPNNIEDLNNVVTNGISNGQVLQWNGTQFVPFTITDQVGATQMSELSDVDGGIVPTDGQSLVYNATDSVFEAQSLTVVGLSDVDSGIVPTDGQILVFNETTGMFEARNNTGAGAAFLDDLNDVAITTPATGDFVRYDGTTFVNETVAIPSAVEDLSNVDTAGITSGQVLQWDGTQFLPASISGVGISLNDVSDVTITTPVDTQFIRYNGTEFVNETVNLVSSSNDLSDVTITTPVDNQFIRYNGTAFVNETVNLVSSSNDLSDVTITTPVDNQFIRYNGTEFVNETVNLVSSSSDLSDVDITDITTGQVLQWDGAQFVPFTISDQVGATQLSELSDVDSAITPSNGQALIYNSVSGNFEAQDITDQVGATVLNELGDVTIATPATGEFVRYNGTEFVNEAVAIPVTVSDLTDVNATGAAAGDILEFDGTNFALANYDLGKLNSLTLTGATNGQALVYNSVSGQYEPQNITDQVGATTLSELSDVAITTPVDNQFIRYNGTEFVNETVTIPTSVSDLSDVDATGATNGDVLVFNSTTSTFEVGTVSSGVSTLAELTDVTITTPVDNQFIRYNGTAFVNETVVIPSAIEDLSNVDTAGITTGQVLQWDGGQFVPFTIIDQTGATTLNELTDVTITTPTTGDFVRHNGTEFVNETVAIPSTIEDLSNVDVTGVADGDVLVYNSISGAFEPANIAGGGATSLDGLSDVDTTGVADGDVLVYDNASSTFRPEAMAAGGGGSANYEWVEFLYSSGSGGTLGAADAFQNSTANIIVNIVDGPNGIVEFRFVGKKYPPIAIMSYGQAASSNEFLIRSIYNYGTKLTTDSGTSANPGLFNGNFTETVTLELTMAVTGSSAGFGQRAHLYVLFAFGE